MSDNHSPTEVAKLPEMIGVGDDESSPTVSVIHVTVTQEGTVVYTHTATSYSYVPTYSLVHPTPTTGSNSNNDDGNNDSNNDNEPISPPGSEGPGGNKDALIGGIIGGVGGFIALVLVAFLLVRRSHLKKKKRNQKNTGNDNLYATPPIRRPMHNGEEIGPYYYDPNETVQGYYEDRLSSQHHGVYSKYSSTSPPSKPTRQSRMTESGHHSTISTPPLPVFVGQTPNEIERNVPHLKESEPPHSK